MWHSGFGAWRLTLKPKDTDEWDCAEAMILVLRRLPSAVGLWHRLTKKYKVDFFVGFSMPSKNKGFGLLAGGYEISRRSRY